MIYTFFPIRISQIVIPFHVTEPVQLKCVLKQTKNLTLSSSIF